MNDLGAVTIGEVLERNHAGFDESDFADAVDTAFRNGWLRPSRTAAASLSRDARDVLSRHGGVPRPDMPAVRTAAAATATRMAAVLSTALSAEQAAERLGIDPSRVRHRLLDGSLHALATGRGRARRFPAWQFTDDGVIPHLGAVLRELPAGLHPLELAGFFLTPQDTLELDDSPVAPRDWLVGGGDPQPVLDLARALHAGTWLPKLPLPPPAETLSALPARTRELATTLVLWRVHYTESAHPTPWNRLRRFGPVATCRFDPHDPPPHEQDEGVAYLARDVPTALAEVFQVTRVVNVSLAAPYLTGFAPARPLTLLDLTGDWPLQIGASHTINTARKDRCRAWARAFRRAWPAADGLYHASAMTGRACVTLFAPAASALPDAPLFSEPLSHPDLALDLASAAASIGYDLV